ncbi:unnamed protein product [Caenorhabditis auriculariae]|uniref:Uncharacterized protein n=1 Tax=Caenorhabditis auriculariae TaxID=2777116 RepID=A0A8S1HL65_9PELO|nr:unnamed protein product [Caenorhabditis auriculariae]
MSLYTVYVSKYHPEADWSPKGLKLFKNESKVSQLIFEKHFTIRKFYDEVILSRSFVDAVFENIDFTIFLKQMAETGLYGVDEMFWPTIFMNQLGLPGQLENPKCHGNVDGITRHSIFKVGRKITSGPFWECKSKWLRHSICVLGVEYLPEIDRATELHMNKPLGEFDFGTVICTAEMLHNRTKGLRKSTFNETYYRNLPEVVELNSKRDGRITRCLGNQLEDFLSAGLSHFSIASLLLISLVPNFDLI